VGSHYKSAETVKNKWNYLTIISALVLVVISAGWWRTQVKLDSHLDTNSVPVDLESIKAQAIFTPCDGLVLCMLADIDQEICELNLPPCVGEAGHPE
jgi:hypothetical protein